MAFWDLGTERPVGMGVGPIPVSAMRARCDRDGIHGDAWDRFRSVIGTMDGVFLAHQGNGPDTSESVQDAEGIKGLLRRKAKSE
jgi:hypothetical protein